MENDRDTPLQRLLKASYEYTIAAKYYGSYSKDAHAKDWQERAFRQLKDAVNLFSMAVDGKEDAECNCDWKKNEDCPLCYIDRMNAGGRGT